MKITSISDNNLLVNINEKTKKPSNEVIIDIVEKCYNNASDTENIIVDKNGFISFTKYFKYFGSFILYDLSDEYDINER